VKRYGNLFDKVCSFDALCAAAREAMRGKRTKPRVARFWLDLEPEVLQLEAELRAGSYRPRPYRTFVVTDPKQRMICAADFRDRVVVSGWGVLTGARVRPDILVLVFKSWVATMTRTCTT